jgi:exopolyphosphatase/guanosine-5'-triphosphate,3'-diphosphate pyrophosphatase
MKSSKTAVIDVGTNTFHLLIVDGDAGDFNEILRKRVFVKLAEDGIEKLGDRAMKRGLETLINFRKLIDQNEVSSWRVTGTAALRTASNGSRFMRQVRVQTGFEIELIDGRKEAQYICEGVKQVWTYITEPSLIMDIGGGSVEFIIATDDKVLWLESFPIGIAILYRKFHQSDPISSDEIAQLEQFVQEVLQPLQVKLQEFIPVRLVGASGTFDVLSNMAGGLEHLLYHEVSTELLTTLLDKIVGMSRDERIQTRGIPMDRVDMIVVAVLLIQQILRMYTIDSVGFSSYALKEGLLAELLQV